MHIYSVLPHLYGWQVRRQGHQLATAVRATRESATRCAEALAKLNRPSSVVIFGADGSPETEVRFDPAPSP